jgi:flagellar hook-associated protein FlgK
VSDLLGIGGNAVTAYQLALGTVSNNIANVSTEGFTRQAVELNSGTPRQVGSAFIGTGVVFDRVKRQYDAFADANLRASSSEVASQEPMVLYGNRIIDLMGSEEAGLVSALDQFFSSARALTTDPASTVLRGEFFRDAQGLASRFGQISSQLDLMDTETKEAVEASLGEVNTLSAQLAAVNEQLAKISVASRQPSELLDQRDRLLSELSEFARIRTSFAVNGSVTVSLGGSIEKDVIVRDTRFFRIGYTFDTAAPERIGLIYDPYGPKPSPLGGVTSGKLAGLLAFREQVLDSTRDAMDFLAGKLVGQVNQLHRSGVDGYGMVGGDLFKINPQARFVAAGLQVAIDDPMRIAAAAQFRVIENAKNTGLADATVAFTAPAETVPAPINTVLVNNPHPSAGKAMRLSNSPSLASVGTISAGLKDVALYLNEASGHQQLQLMTRDGRHLLGSPLSPGEQTVFLQQPGLAAGATYSAQYLGKSGAHADPALDGYKDMDIFYGARAEERVLQRFDGLGNAITGERAPALLTSGRVSDSFAGLTSGQLKLNGLSLPALTPGSDPLDARDIAAWITTWASPPAGAGKDLGISARAFNEVRIPASSLKNDYPLKVGVPGKVDTIVPPAGLNPKAEDWMNAINSRSGDTRVRAYVSIHGELVLTNVDGEEGRSIEIGPSVPGNTLGLEAKVYGGQFEITRSLSNTEGSTSIEIGFGTGKPADLAAMGIRAAAYIRGTLPEDVLVFVNDTTGSEASVSSSYSGQPKPLDLQLREQPMEIEIKAVEGGKLKYQITDINTQTVMAERLLDPELLDASLPGGGIDFQGLAISFSNPPKVGDRFILDGNKDGFGNNDNIRAIAALESVKLVAGTKTISSGYIDHVNEMGNIARQATIAQEALTVVRDQAAETRDKVSGVNLDEEAANLIRFQQAYQASAKVMQMAQQLFDTVVRIQ